VYLEQWEESSEPAALPLSRGTFAQQPRRVLDKTRFSVGVFTVNLEALYCTELHQVLG
jgi:hypothetical protein